MPSLRILRNKLRKGEITYSEASKRRDLTYEFVIENPGDWNYSLITTFCELEELYKFADAGLMDYYFASSRYDLTEEFIKKYPGPWNWDYIELIFSRRTLIELINYNTHYVEE